MFTIFVSRVCCVCAYVRACVRVSSSAQQLAVTVRLVQLSPAASTKLVSCLPLPHVAPSNDGVHHTA